MTNNYDVAVVGAGIVGLAHAWRAAAAGRSVVLFERNRQACGASIRNFGMVWPIGQPPGELHALAMRSRQLWRELADAADIWVNACGSLHIASRPDELAVLEEFTARPDTEPLNLDLLTPEQTLARSPAVNPDGLLGAMWSPHELCVDPTAAIATLPHWLHKEHGVTPVFATTISAISGTSLTATDGRSWSANQIMICSGCDFETLYPTQFATSGLRKCKLQMMRTIAQPDRWRLGPHLASGLTLRHYKAFQSCPALRQLQERIAKETPELDRYGIHVMASQNQQGQVVLGDSHEYDEEISPFDKQEIDDLILRELRRQVVLPDWTIERRWHGVYAKHPSKIMVELEPAPNVCICVGPGGAGMTLSFGYADRYWQKL